MLRCSTPIMQCSKQFGTVNAINGASTVLVYRTTAVERPRQQTRPSFAYTGFLEGRLCPGMGAMPRRVRGSFLSILAASRRVNP